MPTCLSAISPAKISLSLVALIAAPLLASAATAADAPQLTDAWVRLPAAAGRPAGGYFTAHGTANADTLASVTSPKAERIEMHSMVQDGATMKMRAEPSFALPANGELTFAPGGSHLMLFGLPGDLKPGDKVPLTFHFASGAAVSVDAEARAANAMPSGMTGGMHMPAAAAHPH